MTPHERKLVEDLFDRLSTLEARPREPEAERVIMDGLRRAPNAVYPLVQTVLLQEEALRKADERIRELEDSGPAAPQRGGFLDSMRDALFGGGERARGSVPPVRGRDEPMGVPPNYRTGENYQPNAYPGSVPQQEPSRGGSFLGTAAAAAVGVIGGTMLMNSMRNMLGSGHPASGTPSTMTDFGGQNSPWSDASSSDLARQAGVDHIGQSGSADRAGLYDSNEQPFDVAEAESGDDLGLDFDSDIG